MATVSVWSNVGVALESARGGALTVTAITKANPGVATSTAHGLLDGDYVLLVVAGMTQVNGRVFRVAGKTTDTFQLEGENTTNYDTFTTGSAYKITYGTTISTLTGLSASGGEVALIDATTIHDTVQVQVPGVASAATYSFESIWDVSDAGLVALKAASIAKSQKALRFTFANGQKVVFIGYVGCTTLPIGNAQDKVTTPVTVTMAGTPTVYAS